MKYYKAAWGYEVSLLVLKNISTLEETFRIFARPCNILYILPPYYRLLLGILVTRHNIGKILLQARFTLPLVIVFFTFRVSTLLVNLNALDHFIMLLRKLSCRTDGFVQIIHVAFSACANFNFAFLVTSLKQIHVDVTLPLPTIYCWAASSPIHRLTFCKKGVGF